MALVDYHCETETGPVLKNGSTINIPNPLVADFFLALLVSWLALSVVGFNDGYITVSDSMLIDFYYLFSLVLPIDHPRSLQYYCLGYRPTFTTSNC